MERVQCQVICEEARQRSGAWIEIEKPFWLDVPVWLASGHVDSIGLANNHMCRSSMSEKEAWGKPRDANHLPPPRRALCDCRFSAGVYFSFLRSSWHCSQAAFWRSDASSLVMGVLSRPSE